MSSNNRIPVIALYLDISFLKLKRCSKEKYGKQCTADSKHILLILFMSI